MNIEALATDFINKIDVLELPLDESMPLRKKYELTFKVDAWNDFLKAFIEKDIARDRSLKGLHLKAVLDEKRVEEIANRIVDKEKNLKLKDALMKDILNRVYDNLVTELKKNVTHPEFEKISDSGSEIKHAMMFDLLDELPDFDFSTIKIQDYACNLSDDDLETEISRFLDKQVKEVEISDSSRESKDGDILLVDFAGYLGKIAFKGGTAKNYQFELGKGTMLPDFEEGFRGMKVGEEREIKVTFPQDYQAKELAGLEAVFHIKLHKIFGKGKYDGAEDFVKINGIESLDIFRKAVKENLDFNMNYMLWILKKDDLLDKIDAAFDFPIPQIIVDKEMQRAKMNYMQKKVQQLQSKGGESDLSEDGLKNEIEKEMGELESTVKTKVKLSMFFNDLARKNKISLDSGDVMGEVETQAKLRGMSTQDFIDKFCKTEQAIDVLRADAMESKLIKDIFGKVQSEKVEMKHDEVLEKYNKIFSE
jgi:trigger factor